MTTLLIIGIIIFLMTIFIVGFIAVEDELSLFVVVLIGLVGFSFVLASGHHFTHAVRHDKKTITKLEQKAAQNQKVEHQLRDQICTLKGGTPINNICIKGSVIK